MLYNIESASVMLNGTMVLSQINFEIKGKEKIGIVGKNGAGKTTLLKMIAGEITPDRDDKHSNSGIHQSRNLTIGMLKQTSKDLQDKTINEIILEGHSNDLYSRERFEYEMEYDKLFTGLGFDKKDKIRKIGEFSGGQQTKIALIKLLLDKPDILLLDEPTNNLDIESVQWLEEYLVEYPNAIVFVSHDRFFMDQVAEVIYDLSDGKLTRYVGNYTYFRKEKAKRLQIQKKEYDKQQQEIKHLEELIEKFKHKPNKAAFARSRKTMLDRMVRIPEPDMAEVNIFTGDITPEIPGSKWVYEAKHLKVGYEEMLFEISMRIKRGQKIGIIGSNGAGKSTFLKVLAGYMEPLEGELVFGNNITTGYFQQETASITSEKTVAEHYRSLFPKLTEKELRGNLASYLFSGRETAKKVSDLSGGEKTRLVLCELLSQKPNLLILDEPTNHMDIRGKENIESALKAYKGTLIFVSHDRYFVSQVADAILIIEDNRIMYYPFGYEHYISRLRRFKAYGEEQSLSAMIEAEDQAMIADLRAVPKKERHEAHQMNTEEAYVDWQLRLAAEPMETIMSKVEMIYGQIQKLQETIMECELKLCDDSNFEQETLLEKYCSTMKELNSELVENWNIWTDKCIAWYEIYAQNMEN